MYSQYGTFIIPPLNANVGIYFFILIFSSLWGHICTLTIKQKFTEGQSSLENYSRETLRELSGRNSKSLCKEKEKVIEKKRKLSLSLENRKKILLPIPH